jgi:hypothetical protein
VDVADPVSVLVGGRGPAEDPDEPGGHHLVPVDFVDGVLDRAFHPGGEIVGEEEADPGAQIERRASLGPGRNPGFTELDVVMPGADEDQRLPAPPVVGEIPDDPQVVGRDLGGEIGSEDEARGKVLRQKRAGRSLEVARVGKGVSHLELETGGEVVADPNAVGEGVLDLQLVRVEVCPGEITDLPGIVTRLRERGGRRGDHDQEDDRAPHRLPDHHALLI